MGVIVSVTSPAAGSISSYAWTITRPDGTTLTASSAQYVAIFSMPGNYTVSLTVNGNQTQTLANYITVFANPAASFVADDAVGCFPLPIQFTSTSAPGSAPITSWTWDFGNGSTGSGSSASHVYTNVGTYTPVLSIQDANGCFAAVANGGMVQILNTFPIAVFSASPTITCPVPAVVAFQNSSTGNGPLSSVWDFGDSMSQTQSGTGSIDHTYSGAATFPACLEVTDVNGCVASTCQNVTVLSSANPLFTASTSSACTGSAVSFTNQTSPAASQYSWDFNGDGTADSFSANSIYVFQSPGTYTPSLTATYSSGCSATFSGASVIVQPGLVVSFTTNQTTSCEVPFSVTFQNTTFGTGLNSTWYVNGTSVGTGSPYSHTFTTYGNYNITQFVSNSSGCSSQQTQNNLIVVQPASVTFDHPVFTCAGEPFEITAANATTTSPVTEWNWDFNGDQLIDATGQFPIWEFPSAGTFDITLNIVTASGCEASWTSSAPVLVLHSANPGFTSNTTLSCAGESIEFCIPASNGNQFSWNFGDASGWVTMDDGELCLTHDYQDTGYFDITLTVFNQACNSTVTFDNYLYITPPVSIFDFNIDCSNLLEVSFGDLSIEADGLIWDFGDGSASVFNQEDLTHIFPSPGIYEVTLTAINDILGCPDESTATINLFPPSAEMTFDLISDCPPALVNIHSSVSSDNWLVTISNGDSVNIQWLAATGIWSVDYSHNGVVDHSEFSSIENFWPTISFEQAGCYDFQVHSEDEFGCTADAFYPSAVCVSSGTDFASFEPTLLDDCDEVRLSFSPVLDNLVSWEWSFGDGQTSTDSAPEHVYLPPYNYGQPLEVTLTAIDADGCSSTVAQEIPIDFPIIPSFTVSTPNACQDDAVAFTNTSLGSATSYSWSFGDPSSGSNNNASTANADHAYATSGSYDVCLSATNTSGCLRTTCQPAAVQVLTPSASFTYTSALNACLYGVSFDNTSTGVYESISWNFGDGQTGSGDLAFHTYPLGVYDVTLIVSNSFGCVDTLLMPDIFNYGGVIGPFSVELEPVNCAPFDVVLSAFNISDTYFTYFWDFNDGYGDPSGSTISGHGYLDAGVFCPSLIMTDPNGCNVLVECSDPISVSEFTLDYVYDSEVCTGETVFVEITNGDTYVWGTGTPVTPGTTAGEFTLNPGSSATYFLTGFYGDCEYTAELDVVVNELPLVSLTLDNSYCLGEPSFDLYGGLPNDFPGQYSVDGISNNSFDMTNTPGQYDVSYAYTDENGCTSTAEETVLVHNLPVIQLSSITDICDNSPEIALNQVTPAGGVYTMNGAVVSSFDPIVGAGTYPLTYSFTDTNGCTNEALSSIVVHPSPLASFILNSTCQDLPLDLVNESTISSGSIEQTNWSVGPYALAGYQPGAILFDTSGNYALNVSMTSNHGCVSLASESFTIWPVPVSSFVYDITCENVPVPFQSTSTISSGQITSWEWEVNGVIVDSTASASYIYSDYTAASMTLVVTSAEGCDNTSVQSVLVRPSPDVTFSVGATCEGNEVQFECTSSIAYGGLTDHVWNFGAGVPEEHGTTADHLYPDAGTFPIVLTVYSNLGCTTVVNQTITVYPEPEVAFVVDTDIACAHTAIGLLDMSSVQSPSDLLSFAWYFDDMLVSNSSSDLILAPSPGLYDVRLVVTTDAGCESELTEQNAVQVNPVPEAGFNALRDELYMSAPFVTVENTASSDVAFWSYDFGDGGTASFESGQHQYQTWDAFEITQIVTNTFGCSDTTTRVIQVNSEMLVYIPTAFTPDGNGHNEVFKPVMSGFTPIHFVFSVFDRWGKVVFETKDPEGCWNGQYLNQGVMSADGVYNWQLDLKSAESPTLTRMNGVVTLLR